MAQLWPRCSSAIKGFCGLSSSAKTWLKKAVSIRSAASQKAASMRKAINDRYADAQKLMMVLFFNAHVKLSAFKSDLCDSKVFFDVAEVVAALQMLREWANARGICCGRCRRFQDASRNGKGSSKDRPECAGVHRAAAEVLRASFLACARTSVGFRWLTLREGMYAMASILCLEGMSNVYIFVSDVVLGRPWFSWGPEEYSGVLSLVNAVNGVLSIAMGIFCLRNMTTLDPKRVKFFARFLAYISLFSIMWYVAVGSPRRLALKEEPVVNVWPLSTLSSLPHNKVLDPEWPLGKPTVCDDITDFVQHHTMPCSQVVTYFWGWFTFVMFWRVFCLYIIMYFQTAIRVLHFEDDVTSTDDMVDLIKPS